MKLGPRKPTRVLALSGILLAPDVMPILPPTTAVRAYGALTQALADRFPLLQRICTHQRPCLLLGGP